MSAPAATTSTSLAEDAGFEPDFSTPVPLANGPTREMLLGIGLLPQFSCNESMRLAALALVHNMDHLNFMRLLSYIYQAVKFSPAQCKAIAIELDPLAPMNLPADAVAKLGSPVTMDPTPENLELVRSTLLSHLAYMGSGGRVIAKGGLNASYFALNPLYVTTSHTGSTKSQDKLFKKSIIRREELAKKIKQIKAEQENLHVKVNAVLKGNPTDEERLAAANNVLSLEEKELFTKLLAEGTAYLTQLDELDEILKKISQERRAAQFEARDSINFFSLFRITDEALRTKFAADPVWTKSDHMLYGYGFLGACLDENQVAFKVTVHSDMPIDSDRPPFKVETYQEQWAKARKVTVDALLKDQPLSTIKRHTHVYYFWMPINQLSEFTDLLMTIWAELNQLIIKTRQLKDNPTNSIPEGVIS